jgi:hypothetical protein
MSDFTKHVEHGSCTCTKCVLIGCEALPADWEAWGDIEFTGDARVAMMRLVRREPPISPGVRQQYAGAIA